MSWVLRREAVEESVLGLWSRRIHPNLPGYLAMVWTAARDGLETNLRPDFKAFHEYFMRVPGRTSAPYLRPFNSAKRRTAAGEGSIWYQENTAGSYSPASFRGQATLGKVVQVNPDATYSLREGHARLALHHLAFDEPLPVVLLVMYLYREYAFDLPDIGVATSVFRYEFGYESATGATPSADFTTLFHDDSAPETGADLFEEFE